MSNTGTRSPVTRLTINPKATHTMSSADQTANTAPAAPRHRAQSPVPVPMRQLETGEVVSHLDPSAMTDEELIDTAREILWTPIHKRFTYVPDENDKLVKIPSTRAECMDPTPKQVALFIEKVIQPESKETKAIHEALWKGVREDCAYLSNDAKHTPSPSSSEEEENAWSGSLDLPDDYFTRSIPHCVYPSPTTSGFADVASLRNARRPVSVPPLALSALRAASLS